MCKPAPPKKPTQFDPLPFLEIAAKGRRISTHAAGDVLFAQGDPADAVFYLKSGQVKLTVVSRQGKEAVVALLEADEFLGEGCLIGQPLRLATATALTDCVAMRVERVEIEHALRDDSAFSLMFIAHILARKSRVEADLVDQLFNPTENASPACCCYWPISARKAAR